MLQFATSPSEKYSLPEEAQMALEGGCQWIELATRCLSREQAKEAALEIMPLCQEAGDGSFLVIDSDVDLVKELRVHGVHLFPGDMPAAQAREELGPHAVVGVEVSSAEEAAALERFDIDYVTVSFPDATDTEIPGLYRGFVNALREQGCKLPVVARGEFDLSTINVLLEADVSGIALSATIVDSPDPVEKTKEILSLSRS